MRRPLKPFVTEYRGGRRSSQTVEPVPFEDEQPTPRPVEVKQTFNPESDDGYEAAMRAADALFARPGSRQADSVQPTEDASERSTPNGGRILRVVDEAPSPQLVALEAKLAPKKRGRKPGSKNKPKVFALALEAATGSDEASPAFGGADALVNATPSPVTTKKPAASRGEKRFGWVRDRLKPGEDWKRRRLPRVCW